MQRRPYLGRAADVDEDAAELQWEEDAERCPEDDAGYVHDPLDDQQDASNFDDDVNAEPAAPSRVRERPLNRRRPLSNGAEPLKATRSRDQRLPPPEEEGEWGQIQEWSGSGFGFVSLEDGRRAYIHSNDIRAFLKGREGGTSRHAGELDVGQRLRVLTEPDSRNPGKIRVAFVLEVEYEGTVREWNQQKGFGFVHTPAGLRAFVLHTAFGGGDLYQGEQVLVSVVHDKRDPGKLMARRLFRRLGASNRTGMENGSSQPREAAGDSRLSEMHERHVPPEDKSDRRLPRKPDEHELFDRSSRVGLDQVAHEPHDEEEPGQGEWGKVNEWSTHGFGFLVLMDKRRAYIHSNDVRRFRNVKDHTAGDHSDTRSFHKAGELEVGQWVRVELMPDSRNPGKIRVAEILEVECDGIVKDWDARKGYGFVHTEHGIRAFVLHAAFGGGNLELGERVLVRVAPDGRNAGKFMVRKLVRLR